MVKRRPKRHRKRALEKNVLSQTRSKSFLVPMTILQATILITQMFKRQGFLTMNLADNLSLDINHMNSAVDMNSNNNSVDDQYQFDFVPQKVLQQYKAWHGADVLRRESSEQLQARTYAMAYYSCPLQAGNRLHHFLNSLLWSIITNRTVVYQYYDGDTCRQHQAAQTGVQNSSRDCLADNPQSMCERVLDRADWIPSFQELAPRLHWNSTYLSESVSVVDYWKIHHPNNSPTWELVRYPAWKNLTGTEPKIDELQQQQLVDFPMIVGIDIILGIRKQNWPRILATQSARDRLAELHEEGSYFLYGMLLNDVFSYRNKMHRNLTKAITTTSSNSNSNSSNSSSSEPPFSIAMHSRHQRANDDGSNIAAQQACFDQILSELPLNIKSCHVCLMSDRPETIKRMTLWLQQVHHCTVESANHTMARTSFLAEHGPNAGEGLFRELDLCQYSTDGFVGTGQRLSPTSSSLLREMMAYNRRIKQARLGPKASFLPFKECLDVKR